MPRRNRPGCSASRALTAAAISPAGEIQMLTMPLATFTRCVEAEEAPNRFDRPGLNPPDDHSVE